MCTVTLNLTTPQDVAVRIAISYDMLFIIRLPREKYRRKFNLLFLKFMARIF